LRTVNEVLQAEKQKSEAETKKVLIEKEKLMEVLEQSKKQLQAVEAEKKLILFKYQEIQKKFE
jgi:hypothetical protein